MPLSPDRLTARRRVQAGFVVDFLDGARNVGTDVLEDFVGDRVDCFDLERIRWRGPSGHEALGLGVVVWVAGPAHGSDEPVIGERLPVEPSGILRSTVVVMHATRGRSSLFDGGAQGGEHKAHVVLIAERC